MPAVELVQMRDRYNNPVQYLPLEDAP